MTNNPSKTLAKWGAMCTGGATLVKACIPLTFG